MCDCQNILRSLVLPSSKERAVHFIECNSLPYIPCKGTENLFYMSWLKSREMKEEHDFEFSIVFLVEDRWHLLGDSVIDSCFCPAVTNKASSRPIEAAWVMSLVSFPCCLLCLATLEFFVLCQKVKDEDMWVQHPCIPNTHGIVTLHSLIPHLSTYPSF